MANVTKPIDECGWINGLLCGQARKKVIMLQNKMQVEATNGRRPSIINMINKMCREYPIK
jgi:hypothetical protein